MPAFYREHGGCVVSTSINRYMYISIHPYFDSSKTSLKYSETELVNDCREIRHNIFRQVLGDMGVNGVEITSTADVPSGTGLGSSSSFTVGLLHSLHAYTGKYVSKKKIAEEACDVEIKKMGNPIGKQDQYAAACGGLNFISFHPDETVSVEPIIMDMETSQALQDNLVLYYTGISHDANVILAEQQGKISQKNKTKQMLELCNLAKNMKNALESNELEDFGKMLHEGWLRKREMASSITSSHIDSLYQAGIENGASGGKLLGAGGGGFLLFYCEKYKQKKLDKALGLSRFHARFERDGTSVVYIGDKYW